MKRPVVLNECLLLWGSGRAYIEVNVEILHVHLPVWCQSNAVNAKKCLDKTLACFTHQRSSAQDTRGNLWTRLAIFLTSVMVPVIFEA